MRVAMAERVETLDGIMAVPDVLADRGAIRAIGSPPRHHTDTGRVPLASKRIQAVRLRDQPGCCQVKTCRQIAGFTLR